MPTWLARNANAERTGSIMSALMAGLALAGCSVTQLKDQTVSVGRSVGAIYTSQVLENLYNLRGDRNAVPSHFSVSKGSIRTSNSISPTVTIPIGNQVTRGFVTTGGPFGVTGVEAPNRGLALTAAEGWEQSWDITPEKDPKVLTSLNAVYSYVLGIIHDDDPRIAPLIDPPSLTPAKKKEGSASSSCNLTSAGTNCSFRQTGTPTAAPGEKVPTKDDTDLIKRIHKTCGSNGGCFQIREPNAQCIQPKAKEEEARKSLRDAGSASLPAPARPAAPRWICLGEYNSASEWLLGHEMMITEDAYIKNVLFDLVMLSLQIQAEAGLEAAAKTKGAEARAEAEVKLESAENEANAEAKGKIEGENEAKKASVSAPAKALRPPSGAIALPSVDGGVNPRKSGDDE